jgi:hypothetical protein
MVSVINRESKFFTKRPGGYFILVCGIFFLVMVVTAVCLHSLTKPVNPFKYFVSSMGIGPNGSSIALNVGLLVLAFGLYPFIIHLCQLLWMESTEKRVRLNNFLIMFAFIMAMICLPGLIMAGIFTMAPATITLHGIGALLIFIGTMVFGNIFWISLEWHKKSSWMLRICSVCVFIFFACMIGAIMAILLLNPAETQLLLANPGQYIIDLLGNTTDTKLDFVRFFEWFYIISIVIWSLIMGVHSIKIAHERKHG